ncbi:MAG: hypothetical protein KJO94_05210, partial [Eudoraea sp.]|nr:hypothetical protein [Eudoraea sp.]
SVALKLLMAILLMTHPFPAAPGVVREKESCLEEVCYIRDGLVIRCEVLDEDASQFGVGIKILHKVLQANILTSRFN